MSRHRIRRSPLRRRIFVAFGVSIFITGLVAAATFAVLHRRDFDQERIERFVGNRFADVWEDPPRRNALLREASDALDVRVQLLDTAGRPLGRAPRGRCRGPTWTVPVVRDGIALGTAEVCARPRRVPRGPWHFLGVLLIVGVVLWAASGKIARRLVRPLEELERVAREIGGGNLSARVRLRHHGRDEVSTVADAINQMAARIEAQVSGQRELLAAVSHEIRTPLARLRVLLELEREAPGDARRVDEIERELVEIDDLVGQLLAGSKLHFQVLDAREVAAVDLAKAALERAGYATREAREAGTEAQPSGPSPSTDKTTAEARPSGPSPAKRERLGEGSEQSVPTSDERTPRSAALRDESHGARGRVDPSLIARALANLIQNAERHGGGLEALRVAVDGDAVVLEALDRGPGFQDGDLGRVFERFVRGEGAKARGLGLGLALVQRIAHALGGTAYAKNRDGGGACVGVRLPRVASSERG